MKRLVTKSVGNPTTGMRHFHVDETVCETRTFRVEHGYDIDEQLSWRESDPGPVAKALAEKIIEMNGVKTIHFERHSFSVIIDDAFLWEDMEPRIRAILEVQFKQEKPYKFIRQDAAWDYSPHGLRFSECREEFEFTPVEGL
jgi:hypothetical protein